MATFQALVVQDSDSGQVYRVFLIRTESMTSLPLDKLREVQQYVHERYNQSLTPVDLELVTLDQVKERVRHLNRGR